MYVCIYIYIYMIVGRGQRPRAGRGGPGRAGAGGQPGMQPLL